MKHKIENRKLKEWIENVKSKKQIVTLFYEDADTKRVMAVNFLELFDILREQGIQKAIKIMRDVESSNTEFSENRVVESFVEIVIDKLEKKC